ncbi:hypothetical protein ACFRCI_39485 [Streptomyces sp. NPDC056638]|uniref:hypothetical protein n=1 Tax=Streptomyces sp. NPDC056638 TaxID=3345887 RepID=UPI00369FB369
MDATSVLPTLTAAPLLNHAPAGRLYTFTVHAGRPKGWTGSTAMAGVKVSVSYDDGAPGSLPRSPVWTATPSRRRSVTLKAADTDGYVTVRAEAWNAAGNRTVQTVNHAYALR